MGVALGGSGLTMPEDLADEIEVIPPDTIEAKLCRRS
jgi:hypothetical protein